MLTVKLCAAVVDKVMERQFIIVFVQNWTAAEFPYVAPCPFTFIFMWPASWNTCNSFYDTHEMLFIAAFCRSRKGKAGRLLFSSEYEVNHYLLCCCHVLASYCILFGLLGLRVFISVILSADLLRVLGEWPIAKGSIDSQMIWFLLASTTL